VQCTGVGLCENTHQALRNTGLQAEVLKVSEFAEITAYGVMSTPALAIDDQVLTASETETLLADLLMPFSAGAIRYAQAIDKQRSVSNWNSRIITRFSVWTRLPVQMKSRSPTASWRANIIRM
jgi:hypothetical protein